MAATGHTGTKSPLGLVPNPYLDLIRGCAILLVLCRHLFLGQPSLLDTPALAIHLHRGGWIGVDIFFVLSGFLVSGLLFREFRAFGAVNLKRFFIRRAFKVYPTFSVLIMISLLACAFGSTRFLDLLPDLLLIGNYIPGRWGHLWSLANEEQFYLLLGAFVWLMQRRSEKGNALSSIPVICCVMIGLALLFRILTYHSAEDSFYWSSLFPLHLRMDAFAVGVLVSYLLNFHFEKAHVFTHKHKRLLLTLAVVGLIPPFFVAAEGSPILKTVGISFIAIGSGMVVLLLAQKEHDSRLSWRWHWLVMLGRYSYSVYVWHFPIRLSLMPRIEALLGMSDQGVYASTVYLMLSIFGGIAFAHCIEFPVLVIRDRFYPSSIRHQSSAVKAA